MMKLLSIILVFLTIVSYGQTLPIPAVVEGQGNNYFKTGTGDGGTLSTYNSFLRLHYGLAIGSPYTSNGSGGYEEKATISFDGRTGNINTLGNVGIGTLNSAEKLTVQGNIQIPFLSSIGIGQSADKFTHNGNSVGNYSLGWSYDSWNNGGPSSYYSGFGGIKLFTGAQPRLSIDQNGNVGIGTTNPNQKLTVNGTIYGKEVKVDLNVPGPDYVFEPTYNLQPLSETEAYIKANKHLPEVPSAKEMEANGINLSEMNMLLLKKVEELTLHLIEANKKITMQQEINHQLFNEIKNLKK